MSLTSDAHCNSIHRHPINLLRILGYLMNSNVTARQSLPARSVFPNNTFPNRLSIQASQGNCFCYAAENDVKIFLLFSRWHLQQESTIQISIVMAAFAWIFSDLSGRLH
jgi:hypothetical protein